MTDNLLSYLLSRAPKNTEMELPPQIFLDMGGEFIEFIEGEKLVARYPNKPRYANPFGLMQGGVIVAAIDNTVAPLSYLIGPTITKSINTVFKRPIKKSDKYIYVTAKVIEISKTKVELKAEVHNHNNKLTATAYATCVFTTAHTH